MSHPQPHSLRAFLAGVATGALVDNRLERLLWERFEKVLLTQEPSAPLHEMRQDQLPNTLTPEEIEIVEGGA